MPEIFVGLVEQFGQSAAVPDIHRANNTHIQIQKESN